MDITHSHAFNLLFFCSIILFFTLNTSGTESGCKLQKKKIPLIDSRRSTYLNQYSRWRKRRVSTYSPCI